MEKAQTISSFVLSLRSKEKINVRKPLQRIMIPVLNNEEKEEILAVSNLIKSEVNVKEIEYIKDTEGVIKKKIKPNLFINLSYFCWSISCIILHILNFSLHLSNLIS